MKFKIPTFKNEAVLIVVAAIVILQVVLAIKNGQAVDQTFIEGAITVALGIVARLNVFSQETVDQLTKQPAPPAVTDGQPPTA